MIYNGTIIGSCSLCGGAVRLPVEWFGLNLPVATCENCHAVQESQRVVIPMRKPQASRCVKHYPTGTHPMVIKYGL